MTKAAESGTGTANRPTLQFAGTLGEHLGHGVWVPPGLGASWIIEGAAVLEREFEVGPFLSRHMVRAVLQAVLPLMAARV